ncbi:hypothetical protein MANES_07G143516v8 [Manihot esculenta]|uniref:Uncharacterized protein n=1 Tax=Manihot esculenta TaxID=3983 RepID=A0ACB7HL29_MANES|nr:hypothetical protein MANES_07G143516v8 [Manihot esculenta]
MEMLKIESSLSHINSLKDLYLWNFNGTEALPEWLGNLQSLRNLSISNCENLKYFPSATVMQRLSNLRELCILGCLFLGKNCAKGSGSEWSKISHVPYIYIREECVG